jgi:lipoyl synthase
MELAVPAAKKPDWLKVTLPTGETYLTLKSRLRALGLHTVCEEARCPNIGECWASGTATLMLLGDVCTRGCRFCAVKSGNPKGVLDSDEPSKSAAVCEALSLRYVVLTSVDRDDLEDNGAAHFARTVVEIKTRVPGIVVETLTGDFQGKLQDIRTMLESGVDVFAHNIETVERLTRRVRDVRATYRQSLYVLEQGKKLQGGVVTKSSIMLGLGETEAEVLQTLRDLRSVGVGIVTLGQYLRPTDKHLPVKEYVSPLRFEWYAEQARAMGYDYVASGPLVRSSYKAAELFLLKRIAGDNAIARHSTDLGKLKSVGRASLPVLS